MYRDGEENQTGHRVVDDLTPYRRLVELQKEMIALSRKNEHSRRERAVLREQVAREVAMIVRRRTSFRHRLRRSTTQFITRLPGFGLLPNVLKTLTPKPS